MITAKLSLIIDVTSNDSNWALHCRVLPCLAALFLAASSYLFPTAVYAQGEHARRIAAELTVMASDLRKLSDGAQSELHATGLRDRIEGGIVSLDILTRLADQELGKPVRSRFDEFNLMQKGLAQNEFHKVQRTLTTLLEQYPLFLPDILIEDTNEFEQLHSSLCAACHDNPNLNVERPAYNLSKQIGEESELDMFARLLIGVRGDRITGIDNPLSDWQIIGLMRYYQGSPP